MTAVHFHLTCNPEAYDRLTTEIRTTFPSAAEIRSGRKLKSWTLWRQQDTSTPSNANRPFTCTVDGHPEESPELRTMRRAHAPFAVGYRGCAGKSMAYLEISLMLAKTLWYFDFERAPGVAGQLGNSGYANFKGEPGRQREDEFQLFDMITASHDGSLLTFKPRGDFWKEL
ncbi:cytochrome P450 4A5 [Diaporthe helianthi]|uniref:Cytochrome P450 4A5 n=1 Tax=Diaporthe helianthi TaxID=158607 RepID=A0A2P5HHD5_DIAHE|nr:cytochrome P450 4A5 [Diaporthe helianthi]